MEISQSKVRSSGESEEIGFISWLLFFNSVMLLMHPFAGAFIAGIDIVDHW